MLVITVGEVVVDWLSVVSGENFAQARNFYRCLGGNASNVAIGLSRLGTQSKLIAKVGDDLHGKYLIEYLKQAGVDLSGLLVDANLPTAQCYALTESDGEHTYYNWPRLHAAQMLCPEEITDSCLVGANFLHTTGISFSLEPRKSAVRHAIALAKERNMIVSFDANFPTDQGFEVIGAVEEALHQVHILKFNQRELFNWVDEKQTVSLKDAIECLYERYRPLVLAVTLGEQGCCIRTPQGLIRCESFKVPYMGCVGAGDGFVAGLLHCLSTMFGSVANPQSLVQMSLEQWREIAMFANAVGALSTTKIGASEGLPTVAEVERLLNGEDELMMSTHT